MEHISKSVWNLNELLQRVENDQELLCELLGVFKEDFPATMRSLESAVAQNDMKNTTSLSHTLKGMLSNLAATRAAVAAAKLEKTAAAGDRSAIASDWNELQRESAGLLPELNAYLAGVRR